jgi:hypothetical protein
VRRVRSKGNELNVMVARPAGGEVRRPLPISAAPSPLTPHPTIGSARAPLAIYYADWTVGASLLDAIGSGKPSGSACGTG